MKVDRAIYYTLAGGGGQRVSLPGLTLAPGYAAQAHQLLPRDDLHQRRMLGGSMRGCLLAVSFLLVVVASSGQSQQLAQDVKFGMVEGTVVDSSGKPLPGATVTAYIGAGGAARDTMQYQANDTGEFSLRLPEGKVWLSAEKNSEGYPYAFFAFYISTGQEFPTIDVRPGETIKGVVIRVGAKAAHLNYEVLDENGKPIPGRFVFVRLDQSDRPYSTSAVAKDDLLVPPVPFRATFEAKGYKPWHYGGHNWQGKDGIISLKSGEVLNLTIRLQREPSGNG